MVEDEKFFAWLDGELPPEEAAQVAAAVAAIPALSRKAEEHRAMTVRLKGAFGAVAAAPVPDRIAAAASPAQGNVMDFGRAREKRSTRSSLSLWTQAAAMAATLAVGVFAGNMVSGGPTGPPGCGARASGFVRSRAEDAGALSRGWGTVGTWQMNRRRAPSRSAPRR